MCHGEPNTMIRQEEARCSYYDSTNLVIDLLVQVFYEYVALPCLTKSRVALRPHDPASR